METLWAMNGMRTASRDFTEFLAGILTEHMGFKRGKLERCLFVHESNETRVDGIRVPNCTRWRSQRIHSETFCQVRGRMLGHCLTAERKVSDDSFDGTEEFQSAR